MPGPSFEVGVGLGGGVISTSSVGSERAARFSSEVSVAPSGCFSEVMESWEEDAGPSSLKIKLTFYEIVRN